MQLTGEDLATATQGVWHQGVPDVVCQIKTDSRGFEHGDVFLALRGEYFDGHRFAVGLADRAAALIGDSQGLATWQHLNTPLLAVPPLAMPLLEVGDTLQAYGAIAHAWRENLSTTTVIGITGSYGKTTVRSMLSHLLSGLGLKVHATAANLNNLIGVPQTLLATPVDADVALIECGISERGEMQRLADILSPDAVVMTGLTAAHAEGLGGLSGVVQEKSRLLAAVPRDGWCALANAVAVTLREQKIQYGCRQLENRVVWTRQGQDVSFSYQGESANLHLSLPAQHWCENMALVLQIALELSTTKLWQTKHAASFQSMVEILASWEAVDGRLLKHQGVGGCQVLDDAYNANPISMQAALDTLRVMPSRHIAILGDMKELGEYAVQAHASLDVQAIECLWLVGEDMRHLHAVVPTSLWFSDVQALLAWLPLNLEQINEGDTVLIKASHSMGLDKVVNILKSKDVDCAV